MTNHPSVQAASEADVSSSHAVAQFVLVPDERHEAHIRLDLDVLIQEQNAVGLPGNRLHSVDLLGCIHELLAEFIDLWRRHTTGVKQIQQVNTSGASLMFSVRVNLAWENFNWTDGTCWIRREMSLKNYSWNLFGQESVTWVNTPTKTTIINKPNGENSISSSAKMENNKDRKRVCPGAVCQQPFRTCPEILWLSSPLALECCSLTRLSSYRLSCTRCALEVLI